MVDFTFLHPYWLLTILPLALLLPWLKGKAHHSGLIAPHLAKQLGFERGKTTAKPFWLLGIGWLLAIIALAGPSWQKTTMPAYSLSGARVLVMDMSRSMYATDITPNRLTQARFKALDMLPGWKEGSTGLVVYAADGYMVSPLTEDSSTLKTLIPNLSPEIMPIQGSDAAAGIREAISLLKQAGHAGGDIIMVTDGMSKRESEQVMDLLDDQAYRLSILAVGTQQGAPIKLTDGRLLNDGQGKPVIARVELDNLLPLVRSTGGNLQLSQTSNRDVDAIIASTATPREQANKDKEKELEERINGGFWLLIPLMLFALLGFRRGVVIAAMLVLMPVDHAFASPWENSDQQGYQSFQQNDYVAAAEQFSDPQWKGIAQYKAGDYQQAIETLAPLTDPTSRYNLGNAYAQAGQLDEAINTYQDLLASNPEHADAQKNLDVVKKAKEQKEKEQQQQSEQNSSEKKEQASDSQQNDSQSEDQHNSENNRDSSQQDSADKQQSADNADSQTNPEQSQNPEQQQGQDQPQDPNQQQSTQQSVGQQSSSEDSENTEQPSQPVAANDDNTNPLSASDPILKKLEQVPDDTSGLIRAQLLLQARQKQAPQSTENSW
ncbi:VWA domain-containing protein [Photobacterium lipolyticum]|uniref:VWFA domain-containing protein n=1 Tax=Photobacterium lipolyticum TaxID=266810 RepID=A0A2T3MSC9_9GAMM|nr:VWA domain-containing protein [Photobacterium lipolyticum]PSW00667.1 hypothetical protein C9I89_20885 [Photobacterium lipolyticum]